MELSKLLNREKIVSDTDWSSISMLQVKNKMSEIDAVIASEVITDESKLLGYISRAYRMEKLPNLTVEQLDITSMKSNGFKSFVDKNVLLLKGNGDNLSAVMYDPSIEKTVEWLRNELHVASIFVTNKSLLLKIINQNIKPLLLTSVSSNFENGTNEDGSLVVTNLDVTNERQIMDLLHSLVKAGIESRASDMQIVPNLSTATVFFRIDNQKIAYTEVSLAALLPLYRVLAEKCDKPSHNEKQGLEGKASFSYNGRGIDTRVNIIVTRLGMSINIRFQDSDVKSYNDLGMSDHLKEALSLAYKLRQGLVLFVGPTGSGKSTTMTALISQLCDKNINICTAEDPVEKILPGVNQVDVQESGMSYETSLKAFMRHDPDVIMIGEIRDLEVAREVIRASDTGQLVISTLHTKDAVSTINRLLNIGIEPSMLAESLTIIVSQRLIRRVCPDCREVFELEDDSEYRKYYDLPKKVTHVKGKGCDKCNHTGYYGRVCIGEYVVIGSDIRRAIESNATSDEIRTIIKSKNFRTMIDDGISKVLSLDTSFDEVELYRIDSDIREGIV